MSTDNKVYILGDHYTKHRFIILEIPHIYRCCPFPSEKAQEVERVTDFSRFAIWLGKIQKIGMLRKKKKVNILSYFEIIWLFDIYNMISIQKN